MNRNAHLAATRPNGIAPSPGGFRLGGKSGALARAWQYVWDRLSTAEYVQAQELAKEAALKHVLRPISVMTLIHRMVKEGALEGEKRSVQVTSERTVKSRGADGKIVKVTHAYVANIPKLHVRIASKP